MSRRDVLWGAGLAAALALGAWLRRWRDGVWACVLVSLSAWLHPISAVFPAVALAFILAEDLAREKGSRAAQAGATLALALCAAVAIAIPLVAPALNDFASL